MEEKSSLFNTKERRPVSLLRGWREGGREEGVWAAIGRPLVRSVGSLFPLKAFPISAEVVRHKQERRQ